MEYNFSDNLKDLKPSAIREILKFTSEPGYIPFAAGNPAPETLPTDAVSAILSDIMMEQPVDALQYSVTEGYAPLRKTLKDYLKSTQNIGRDSDELIITSGAQQVMSLSAAVLCDAGDTVVCEDPSFIGSLNAFRAAGLKLVGVPVEKDGMNVELLDKVLDAEKNVKFIYTIPNFQNPAGVCMSVQKRKALYETAKQHKVMIVEDNPYGDTCFDGVCPPSVKSFDEDGIVIYAGSFSKVISPGLRVGFALAPSAVISKMVVCKQTADVHTSILSQMICYRFMTGGGYENHLSRNREIYRNKCGLMQSLLDRDMAPFIEYNKPSGGLFIWCRIKNGSDAESFCKKALERRVAVVPGSAFSVAPGGNGDCFRLNYSTPTDEQIVNGIGILGEVAKATLG